MDSPASLEPLLVVGRYLVFDEIAAGGMGAVHIGRMLGPAGFSRTIVVKRLHAHLAKEAEFVQAFVDEARLASRIQHPNVIQTLDVLAKAGEVYLVMEFVLGEVLSVLSSETNRQAQRIPRPVVLGLMSQVLQGLHAAHEARDERGRELNIIHRDVSPQNVMVGADGVARVLDFGVAKANGRLQTTDDGKIKGKFAYMPPEHILSEPLTRTADVYSASVILWELLTGQRLFRAADRAQTMFMVTQGAVRRPSKVASDIPDALEEIVLRGLSREPASRFPTAREMAVALERTERAATPMEIAEWLGALALPSIENRRALVTQVESSTETQASLDGVARVTAPSLASSDEVRHPTVAGGKALVGSSDFAPAARSRARVALIPSIVAVTLGGLVLFLSTQATRPASGQSLASTGTAAATSSPSPPPAPPPVLRAPSSSSSPRSLPMKAPPRTRPGHTATPAPGDGLFERN